MNRQVKTPEQVRAALARTTLTYLWRVGEMNGRPVHALLRHLDVEDATLLDVLEMFEDEPRGTEALVARVPGFGPCGQQDVWDALTARGWTPRMGAVPVEPEEPETEEPETEEPVEGPGEVRYVLDPASSVTWRGPLFLALTPYQPKPPFPAKVMVNIAAVRTFSVGEHGGALLEFDADDYLYVRETPERIGALLWAI